jgi:RNA polymerase sigma factor for flagellar operon FliA
MTELKHKQLWVAFWQDRSSTEARAALMEAWMPLVRVILARVAVRLPSHVAQEDLLQVALIGLYGAIERFSPDQFLFETFASQRIRGAILDELRGNDYMSRGMRARLRKVESTLEGWIRDNGAPPSDEELAEALGISVSALRSTLEQARPWLSLDQAVMNDDQNNPVLLRDVVAQTDFEQPNVDAEREEMRRFLRRAFRQLSSNEQKILYLYYFEDLRLREIGALFEVTEARICQIITAATLKLRATLGTYGCEDHLAAS